MNELITMFTIMIIVFVIYSFTDIKVKFTKGKGSWLKPLTWIKVTINKEK